MYSEQKNDQKGRAHRDINFFFFFGFYFSCILSFYALQLIILKPWEYIKYSDDLFNQFILYLPFFPVIIMVFAGPGIVKWFTEFAIKPFKHLGIFTVTAIGMIYWFICVAVIYGCVIIYPYISKYIDFILNFLFRILL